eukprot:4943269-Pyramimonas_sp.AAC.1
MRGSSRPGRSTPIRTPFPRRLSNCSCDESDGEPIRSECPLTRPPGHCRAAAPPSPLSAQVAGDRAKLPEKRFATLRPALDLPRELVLLCGRTQWHKLDAAGQQRLDADLRKHILALVEDCEGGQATTQSPCG